MLIGLDEMTDSIEDQHQGDTKEPSNSRMLWDINFAIGGTRGPAPKQFLPSNSRKLWDIDFKLIGLDEMTDGIEYEHQGAP